MNRHARRKAASLVRKGQVPKGPPLTGQPRQSFVRDDVSQEQREKAMKNLAPHADDDCPKCDGTGIIELKDSSFYRAPCVCAIKNATAKLKAEKEAKEARA